MLRKPLSLSLSCVRRALNGTPVTRGKHGASSFTQQVLQQKPLSSSDRESTARGTWIMSESHKYPDRNISSNSFTGKRTEVNVLDFFQARVTGAIIRNNSCCYSQILNRQIMSGGSRSECKRSSFENRGRKATVSLGPWEKRYLCWTRTFNTTTEQRLCSLLYSSSKSHIPEINSCVWYIKKRNGMKCSTLSHILTRTAFKLNQKTYCPIQGECTFGRNLLMIYSFETKQPHMSQTFVNCIPQVNIYYTTINRHK